MTPDEQADLRRAALSLRGKRVLVMGLGVFSGGASAARFLVREGADVTVTDLREEADLGESMDALGGLPIRFRLGGHDDEDFKQTDLVVANPAVPVSSPFLASAEKAGVPITTEMGLFAVRCPSPVVAVTGSSGKTTTTTLAAEMIKRFDRGTRVGGNLGVSLLEDLDLLSDQTPVVLELSSFQLRHLGRLGWHPSVAVVTNFSPNHLDIHGSLEDYLNSKQQILRYQAADETAVLNLDDPEVSGWTDLGEGNSLGFGRDPGGGRSGVFIESEVLKFQLRGNSGKVCSLSEIRIPGRHNLANAAAATCAAMTFGAGVGDAAEVLSTFEGVPHRLETVRELEGVIYVNDSIATSPDRTGVALEASSRPTVLIAGGYDKGISFESIGEAIAECVHTLILMGDTGPKIEASLPESSRVQVLWVDDLESAISTAVEQAKAGDRVLLSPASASYGMFRNFEERGERFREIVERL